MIPKISYSTQTNNAYAYDKQNQKSPTFQGILTLERDLTKKPALLKKVKDTEKVMADMATLFSDVSNAIKQILTEEGIKPVITSIKDSKVHQVNFESDNPLLKSISDYVKNIYSLFDIKVTYKD